MRKIAGSLIGAFAVLGLGCTERASAPREEAQVEVQKSVECRWAKTRIKIDGKLNEIAWDDAVEVKDFVVNWEKRKARTGTRTRLMWDDHHLYFAAEMDDADLYAKVREKNGMTWYDDVFELFFKPSVDKDNAYPHQYYEYQVNALNTPLELFLPSRGCGGYNRTAALTKVTIESAVVADGTLNDWTDTDKGWVVEGRIPWTSFKEAGGRPEVGAKWKFALCRFDYSVAHERTELSSSAPLTKADFHSYEDYGELVFVGPK